MFTRIHAAVALIAAVVAGLLVAPSAAHAATATASLTVANFAYPGGECAHHYGALKVTAPGEWSIEDAAVQGPSHWVTPNLSARGTGNATRTVAIAHLCPTAELPGLYTVTANLITYDGNGDIDQLIPLAASFTIKGTSPEPSLADGARLTITKAKARGNRWKIAGSLTQRRRAVPGQQIRLQTRNRFGEWVTVRTKATNRAGRVAFTHRSDRPVKVRLFLYVGDPIAPGAKSRTLRLPRR